MTSKTCESLIFYIFIFVILTSEAFTIKANATYYSVAEKVSHYSERRKIGYDGKILDTYACATKQDVDNPPKGTLIFLTNSDSGKKLILYKYDIGAFPPGVILDVQDRLWISEYLYSLDKGYFNGSYHYF